jgi:hypothetical protein
MSLLYATHAAITERARKRPGGYVAELMRCAVSEDAGGVTFDTSNPLWESLRQKYRKTYGIGDGIAAITGAVGIEPCGGCEKRRKALNAFTRARSAPPASPAPREG